MRCSTRAPSSGRDKYVLVARVEGSDRKSFFAVAESPNGVDNFRFWERPITMPETEVPDTNVYDMRLVAHEDGWIYGLFCTERRDPAAPDADQSAAVGQAAASPAPKTSSTWERLPDLTTNARPSSATWCCTPSSCGGKYAFLHPPAGRLHRRRQGRRHRLWPVGIHGSGRVVDAGSYRR